MKFHEAMILDGGSARPFINRERKMYPLMGNFLNSDRTTSNIFEQCICNVYGCCNRVSRKGVLRGHLMHIHYFPRYGER